MDAADASTPDLDAGDLALGPPSAPWDDARGGGAAAAAEPAKPAEPSGEPFDRETTLFVPAGLNAELRPYQRDGVRFLYRLYASRKGGVLADDMGLGKTVQTVAFLAAVLKSPASRAPPPALIVCPTSVLSNWENELRRWGDALGPRYAPGFRVEKIHGPTRRDAWARAFPDERDDTFDEADKGDGVRAERGGGGGGGGGDRASSAAEIVLTAYDTFRQNAGDFASKAWSACVFDEAHRLKNEKALVYEAARTLPRERRFGLTGTVMQNTYEELWCLLDWACPGSLGAKAHFLSYYSKKMQQAQRFRDAPADAREAARDEIALGVGRARADQLKKLLRKYILKRTKKEELAGQLPSKADNVVFCDLSPLQHRAYARLLDTPEFQLLVRHEEPCDCGSGEKRAACCYASPAPGQDAPLYHSFDHDHGGGGIRCPYCIGLACLSILAKVSNHLELLKPDPRDEPRKYERDRAVAAVALGEDADALGGADHADANFQRLSDATHCGKMLALERLLAIWHEQNDKVILFSKSTRLLDILEVFLNRRGYVFCRLDGGVAQKHRQGLVDDFNASSSMFVFLLSTRAGGVGLNITSANRVVIFDPDWNPAIDLQAQDRAYRIGQNRDVDVYRFLTNGTLEEIVYQRQVYKQQQSNVAVDGLEERRYFEGVQGDANNKGELFGFSNMFALANERVRMEAVVARERRTARQFYRLERAPNPPSPSKSQRSTRPRARASPDRAGNRQPPAGGSGSLPASTPRVRAPRLLDGERDGVAWGTRHERIVGNPSRREEDAGRRARGAAERAGALRDEGPEEDPIEAFDADPERGLLRGGKRRRGIPDAAETANEPARADADIDADIDASASASADAVVIALAEFEGVTPAEMGRRLLDGTTGRRAGTLRRFLAARGVAGDGLMLFH